nr:diacylglycerol kinase family protein [Zhihengliuella flava]
MVVNPRGRARARGALDAARLALRRAGYRPELMFASRVRAATGALTARLNEPGLAAVVAVGGDGTVHHVVNALMVSGRDVPLGLLPVGTGNDFARVMGLSAARPAEAVARLVGALPDVCSTKTMPRRPGRRVDVGRVDSAAGPSYFVGVFSAGFDAVVNRRADRLRWVPAGQRYNVAVLVELVRFVPRRYRMTLDGRPSRPRRYLLAACANGQYIGSGMRIAPQADVADGRFDVLTVDQLAAHRWGMVARFLTVFPRVFAGTHLTVPGVRIQRARTVRLELASGAPILAHADGEPVAALPATVTVVPQALRLLL